MHPPSLQLLSRLADKYRRLICLRNETVSEPPRAELRSLAREFPGSLRELDRLPLAMLHARLDALEAVLGRGAEPQAWMRLQVSYHGFMRATLRVKRWSRDWPAEPDEAQRALAARYVAAADEPALGFFDAETIRAIRKPAFGRLNPFVLASVARFHGTTPEAVVEALLYPPGVE